MRFRDETWDDAIHSKWDEAIFNTVVYLNEYGLLLLDNAVILDIGAHIGSFAYMAQKLGASRIYCYEASPDNFELLKENTFDFSQIEIHNRAVWRSDEVVDKIFFQRASNSAMTGSGGVMCTEGIPVPAVRFDEILNIIGNVDLLKLDAEGSEFPILFTSQRLNQINEIVGEYHEIYNIPQPLKIEGQHEFTGSALVQHLQKSGFNVEFEHVEENLGKFHAWRPGKRLLSNLLIEEISSPPREHAEYGSEKFKTKAEKYITQLVAEKEYLLSRDRELQSVYASYSWRITAPLRFIHRIFFKVG